MWLLFFLQQQVHLCFVSVFLVSQHSSWLLAFVILELTLYVDNLSLPCTCPQKRSVYLLEAFGDLQLQGFSLALLSSANQGLYDTRVSDKFIDCSLGSRLYFFWNNIASHANDHSSSFFQTGWVFVQQEVALRHDVVWQTARL